jgi:hypothetical protein
MHPDVFPHESSVLLRHLTAGVIGLSLDQPGLETRLDETHNLRLLLQAAVLNHFCTLFDLMKLNLFPDLLLKTTCIESMSLENSCWIV